MSTDAPFGPRDFMKFYMVCCNAAAENSLYIRNSVDAPFRYVIILCAQCMEYLHMVRLAWDNEWDWV